MTPKYYLWLQWTRCLTNHIQFVVNSIKNERVALYQRLHVTVRHFTPATTKAPSFTNSFINIRLKYKYQPFKKQMMVFQLSRYGPKITLVFVIVLIKTGA